MLLHAAVYCAVVACCAHDVDAVNDGDTVLLRDVDACLAVVLLEVEVACRRYSNHEVRVLFQEPLHRLGCESSARLVISGHH